MTLSPAQIGALRALGVTIIIAILTFLGDATNLNAFVGPTAGSIVAMLALSFEHYIESNGGGALFGAANKPKEL